MNYESLSLERCRPKSVLWMKIKYSMTFLFQWPCGILQSNSGQMPQHLSWLSKCTMHIYKWNLIIIWTYMQCGVRVFLNFKGPITWDIRHIRFKLATYGKRCTAWKMFKYGIFSGPYFPAFGLNTERYFVSLHIQSECGKIRTKKKIRIWTHFTQKCFLLWIKS